MATTRRTGLPWVITSAGFPIIGSFAASQFVAWALRETGKRQAWLFIVAVALLLGVVGVTIAAKVIEHRRGVTIEAAKRKQLVRFRDQLMPFASTAADMARYPLEERAPFLKAVAKVAASALATVAAEHVDRPRAVVYLLDADASPPIMESIGHSGRGERPRPFVAGTSRGDGALNFLNGRRAVHYQDLDEKKPDGYDGTMSDYRAFVSVPIWTETGVYGMVTLDAPTAKSLDAGDVALTELVAELMSIPFEVGQDQNTPDPTGIDSSMR